MKRVLHVDGDGNYRWFVRQFTEVMHFECTQCDTLRDGVRTFREQGPFDLIVLRDRLPDAPGTEFVRLLRATDIPLPKIVVFVDVPTEEERMRWATVGVTEVVGSSIGILEFVKVLKRLTDQDS